MARKLRYFDAEGNEVDRETYVSLFHDQGYRQLARTTIHKRWFVATSWIGIDLATRGRPLYFETVVQDVHRPTELESVAKYPTRPAALTGHRHIVNQIRSGRMVPFRKR
jgi:hypothetical protein